MKRTLSILVVSIILFVVSGAGALADWGGVPDTTPPVVYAVGIGATTVPLASCPGSHKTMIQAKAFDAGGVSEVKLETRSKGTTAWSESPLTFTLQPDGYWRAYFPKPWGLGALEWRIVAKDWREPAPNKGYSGIRTLTVADCDVEGPRIGSPTYVPTRIYASDCPGPKMLTVQTVATDPAGVFRVELWYRTPGASAFVMVPMTRYLNNAYRVTVGPFPAGSAAGYFRAWDNIGNMSRRPASSSGFFTFAVADCP